MSLLNDPFPIIETYTIPKIRFMKFTRPTTGICSLEKFFKTNDAWYCMVTTEKTFKHYPLKKLLGPINYEKIVNKTASIVIDLPFEPFLNCIDAIYEDIVIGCGIPPSQIIFMSNMYDAHEYNINTAARFNSEPIRIFWFSALEYMMRDYAPQVSANTLEIKNYDKKFLNLNRRWRTHRPLLTLLLYHKNLLDKGYVSFGPCESHGDWNKIWDVLKYSAKDNSEMLSAITQSESIKNMPPLYLDTDNLHINKAELDMEISKYYEDSYFSLVSETTFYYSDIKQNSRFVTEKTFKAILMKHPFVLATIPKTLEVLKELGYKTFSPIIDESYDQEMNDNKRMMMIVKEVERLSNLSQTELVDFLNLSREICNHNYQVLINKQNFVYTKD